MQVTVHSTMMTVVLMVLNLRMVDGWRVAVSWNCLKVESEAEEARELMAGQHVNGRETCSRFKLELIFSAINTLFGSWPWPGSNSLANAVHSSLCHELAKVFQTQISFTAIINWIRLEIFVDSGDFIHANRKIILRNRYLDTFSSVSQKETGCLGVKSVF